MSVAGASGTDGDVRYGVVIGLKYLVVPEHLVPEGVEPVQGDPQVGRLHPFLWVTWQGSPALLFAWKGGRGAGLIGLEKD
jgi:hypothetical protein